MLGKTLVLLFDDSNGAAAMLEQVNTWAKEGLINVEEAVVVSADTGSESAQNRLIKSVSTEVKPGTSVLFLQTSGKDALDYPKG